jgi:tetratricopeptide (TPR) repeat protein
MGLIYMNSNRTTEAEEFYLKEIRINPKFEHVYYNLGLLYYGTNRVEKALPLWEQILTMNPYYTDAYRALLQVYNQLNRQEDFNRIYSMAEQHNIRVQ